MKIWANSAGLSLIFGKEGMYGYKKNYVEMLRADGQNGAHSWSIYSPAQS